MNRIRTLFRAILKDRGKLKAVILQRLSGFYTSDEKYLKRLFRYQMGQELNLDNPLTFSEKLQWLKLYNRKPEYTQMVDKYEAKKYVANIIGEKYIIPTIGVWDKFDDIDFNTLPNQFVLKTTHGGGNTGVVICKDKTTFDKDKAKQKLEKSLKSDIYSTLREWPYKDVVRRIIAEQYIKVDGQSDLPDYKFFCFNGDPQYCQVIRNRNSNETIDFYDMEWNHMIFVGLNPVNQNGIGYVAKNGAKPIDKPRQLNELISICKQLAHNIPFVRIDMYVINDLTYFGEITFFPASGMGCFNPSEWNFKLGEMIKLNNHISE